MKIIFRQVLKILRRYDKPFSVYRRKQEGRADFAPLLPGANVKPMEISAPNIAHFNCVAALLNINQSLSFFDMFVFMPILTF